MRNTFEMFLEGVVSYIMSNCVHLTHMHKYMYI